MFSYLQQLLFTITNNIGLSKAFGKVNHFGMYIKLFQSNC